MSSERISDRIDSDTASPAESSAARFMRNPEASFSLALFAPFTLELSLLLALSALMLF
jgi:hypothetical protein